MRRRDRIASQHFLVTAKHIYCPGKPLLHPPTAPCSIVLRRKTVAPGQVWHLSRDAGSKWWSSSTQTATCPGTSVCVCVHSFSVFRAMWSHSQSTSTELQLRYQLQPQMKLAVCGGGNREDRQFIHWKLFQARNFMPQQQWMCLGQAVSTACIHFLEEEREEKEGAGQSNGRSLHLSCYLILFQGPWRMLSETTQHTAVRGWASWPPHKASVLLGCDDQQTPQDNSGRRYYFHKKHSY